MKPLKLFYFVSGFCALVLTWCCDNKPVVRVADTPTILHYIASNPDLSYLNAAIERANKHTMTSSVLQVRSAVNLAASFAEGGTAFTFFAPTNEAFQRAGLTLDVIARTDSSLLDSMIRYGIVSGSLNFSNLGGPLQISGICLIDNKAYRPQVTSNAYGIFINAAKVIQQDIPAGDGYVQIIDQVLTIPEYNLYTLIKRNPKLTYTAAALDYIPYFKQLAIYDSSTLIVPTDSAWQLMGYKTAADLLTLDTATLYEVFYKRWTTGYGESSQPKNYFTPQWLGGFVSFYNGFAVSTDGLHLISSNNPTPPYLIYRNILGTNGVLHIMDQVYLGDQSF